MMEERRNYKNSCTETGKDNYKEFKQTIQKQCRIAKDNYYNENCIELEDHGQNSQPVSTQKDKKNSTQKSKVLQLIKDKQGKCLLERDEIFERWAEYIENVYKDKERGEEGRAELTTEVYSISMEEIREVIKYIYLKRRPMEMIIFLQNCCSVREKKEQRLLVNY